MKRRRWKPEQKALIMIEREVALEHGQETLGIRRVAGLDHHIRGH